VSHLFIARRRDHRYRIEVCDDPAGRCSHGPGSEEHRAYNWDTADTDMEEADVLREVRLLEAHRASQADRDWPLPEEGEELGRGG